MAANITLSCSFTSTGSGGGKRCQTREAHAGWNVPLAATAEERNKQRGRPVDRMGNSWAVNFNSVAMEASRDSK